MTSELNSSDLQTLARVRSSVEMDVDVPAFANGQPGLQVLDVAGNAFYLVDATGDVKISTERSPAKTYRKSTGERFPMEQAFGRLEIQNYGAKTSLRIWAGWGEYVDRRFEMLEAHTAAVGWNGSEIPAMDHVDFVPMSGGGYIRRKSILITNLDPNENLRVTDQANNTLLSVFPRTTITLPLADTIRINNDTGAPVSCNVGEIYYVEGRLISAAS